jgi:hypothetical protein
MQRQISSSLPSVENRIIELEALLADKKKEYKDHLLELKDNLLDFVAVSDKKNGLFIRF